MEEDTSKKNSEETIKTISDDVKPAEATAKPNKLVEGDARETTSVTDRREKGESRRERPPYQNQQFKTQRPSYIKKPAGSNFYYRKKVCKVCTKDFIGEIDYKNVYFLKRFITDRGKILPRRLSGFCAKHHRLVIREIKRARSIALLSYTERGT